jgi:hypothetical protein
LHPVSGKRRFPPALSKSKAHVEAAAEPAPPRPQIFERLTPKAKESLFFSRYEASATASMTIEPEHILLGLGSGVCFSTPSRKLTH